MAKADESGLSSYEIATRAMADKICEEIDNDLRRVLENEIAMRAGPICINAGDLQPISISIDMAAGDNDVKTDWVMSTVGETIALPESGSVFLVTDARATGTCSSWSTTMTLMPCDWNSVAYWYYDRGNGQRLYDGLTAAQCLEKYEISQRGEQLKKDALSLVQLEAAKEEWSRRLREKQAEAKSAEVHQVLIDLDFDD